MPESPQEKLRPPPEPPAETFAPAAEAYAELDVTTNFSFLRGASHPDELVLRAARLGHRAIAVTDLNTLAGAVRMYDAARQVAKAGWGPKLIVGARLALADAPDLLVWAPDRAAYARLCRLLTLGRRRAPKGECHLALADFLDHADSGLLAGLVPSAGPFLETVNAIKPLRDALGDRLSLIVSRVYGAGNGGNGGAIGGGAGAGNTRGGGGGGGGADDQTRVRNLASLSRRFDVPLLATNAVHYHDPSRRPLQDVLTCVRHGCSIQQAGFRLFPNAERHLKSPAPMHRLFADLPGALRRTIDVAERCTFSLDELRYEYPAEIVPAGKTSIAHLSELAWSGAGARYPGGIPAKVRDLIVKELDFIQRMRFEAYFLTVHDVVRYARSRGILCQGRGSAANSAVCYCLGVTSVDPAKIDVLFERFLSTARGEPPDIDIDFEHERREEVIQYVYAKYGRDRAGMTATVITYRGRSAVRDVGKALGLGLDVVDQLAKRLDWWHRGTLSDEQIAESGVDPKSPTVRALIALTSQLLGFPRHLSQHTGGMVMTRGPLCEMVPIENASMDDRTVIEWDKDDIDAVGILKVDVLALGMLTVISKAFKMLEESDEATKRRSDGGEEEGESDGATEGRSDGGEEGEGKVRDGHGSYVSRPDRVAEGNGVGAAGIRGNSAHAGSGAVRPDRSDAPGGRIDPVDHRRRTRATEPPGLPEVPAHRARVPGGTGNAGRACYEPAHDAPQPRLAGDAGRGGPHPPRPDPQPGEQTKAGHGVMPPRLLDRSPSVPPSLRRSPLLPLHRSVASSLRRSFHRYAIHTLPDNDPATYDMICDADTVGVFQIESRAQMSMLPRLQPRCFYDLVIEVAIVRPGPIQGNMVHPYLQRREMVRDGRGDEITYESEELRDTLAHTLGVPLFQEQAMRVVMVAAGFSAEEADQLRRAMASWRKNGVIDTFYPKIIRGMLQRGYTREFAERVFEQIRGFGEYGFPESHAASFAILVYASAWIKRHHPAVFCAALLNSQPMGFYAPAQIVIDARAHGVEVRPVDVNESGWDCGLEERHGGKGEEERHGGTEARRHEGGEEGEKERVNSLLPSCLHPPSCLRASVPSCLRASSDKSTWGLPGPAVRLGFRRIKGMREAHAEVIVEVRRRRGRFASVEQLHRATGLPVSVLRRLAEADAFGSLGLSRRDALWQVMALTDEEMPLFEEERRREDEGERRSDEATERRREGAEEEEEAKSVSSPPSPSSLHRSVAPPLSLSSSPSSPRRSVAPSLSSSPLPPMPLGQEVMTDYATGGLSLKRHPVALVREQLRQRRVITAAELMRLERGWVRVAGLVLIRQRPGTASGIVFETLEDETGVVNLIVRPDIYEKYRPAARHAGLLECHGCVERQGKVVHVMAKRLFDLSGLLAGYQVSSRDFH